MSFSNLFRSGPKDVAGNQSSIRLEPLEARFLMSANNGVGNGCNRRHREQNKADGEEQDRPQMATEIAPRGEERRRKNERRQTEVKHEIRIQLERG